MKKINNKSMTQSNIMMNIKKEQEKINVISEGKKYI